MQPGLPELHGDAGQLLGEVFGEFVHGSIVVAEARAAGGEHNLRQRRNITEQLCEMVGDVGVRHDHGFRGVEAPAGQPCGQRFSRLVFVDALGRAGGCHDDQPPARRGGLVVVVVVVVVVGGVVVFAHDGCLSSVVSGWCED